MKNKIIVLLLSIAICVIVESSLRAAAIVEPSAQAISAIIENQAEGAQKIAFAILDDKPNDVENTFYGIFTEDILLQKQEAIQKLARDFGDKVNEILQSLGISLSSLNNNAKQKFFDLMGIRSVGYSIPEGSEFEKIGPHPILQISEYLRYCDMASWAQTCKFVYPILKDELTLIKYWTRTPHKPDVHKGNGHPVSQVQFSADGNFLVTVTKFRCTAYEGEHLNLLLTYILDLKKRKLIPFFQAFEKITKHVSFSPESKLLAKSYTDESEPIRVQKIESDISGALEYPIANDPISSLAISLDGSLLATAGKNSKMITVFDIQTGEIKFQRMPPVDCDNIYCLAFLPDRTLVSCQQGKNLTLLFWNVEDNEIKQKFEYPKQMMGINYYRNGTMLVCKIDGSKLTLWDIQTGRHIADLIDGTSPVHCVTYTNDGSIIAAGYKNGHIKLWNIKTGTLIKQLIRRATAVSALDFSHDGKKLVAGHANGDVVEWTEGQLEKAPATKGT